MGARADPEGPQLAVTLNNGVSELASNKALGIEDCMESQVHHQRAHVHHDLKFMS